MAQQQELSFEGDVIVNTTDVKSIAGAEPTLRECLSHDYGCVCLFGVTQR